MEDSVQGRLDFGRVVVFGVVLVCAFCSGAFGQPWDGNGVEGDPYQIWTAEDMQAIGGNSVYWSAHFKLMADIDLSNYAGTSFNIIGNLSNAFTGVFDGNDHRIFNFSYSCNEEDYIGLFGYINSPDSEIKNVGLWDPNIDANDGEYVASLAGRVESGRVTNCYILNGSIFGFYEVGGLVGYNNGTLSLCDSKAEIKGGISVGGLVGSNYGQISDGYATGDVRGINPGLGGGGLAGYNLGLVDKCYSTGRVSGFLSSSSGGLVGSEGTGGSTTNSFWDVNTGLDDSDGGIGKTTEEMQTGSTFTSAGWDFVTPVWTICEGADYPRIWRPNIKYNGGSGTANDPYLIFTRCQMQQIGTEVNDWDKHFKLMADIDLSSYTGTSFNIIGNDVNAFTGVFDGNGCTISNFTYEANGVDHVGLFGFVEAGGELKQLGLVDVEINSGTGNFVGGLAGTNYGSIMGCYVTGNIVGGGGWTLGGLAGENLGDITDCYFEGSVYGSTGEEIGGLVGDNYNGSITNCYAKGMVWADMNSGSEEIGGLAGENGGPISYSWADCTVSGDFHVGGLVGHNYDIISDCYASGSVDGNCAGGLAGASYWGTIINCYSYGGVSGNICAGGLLGDNDSSTISNSFWDVNTSGESNSVGGTGLTTEEMQMESTFTDAGWDFNDIWRICERENYPKLRWEKYTGGSGISGDPYLICSAEEMQTIGANPDDWGGHFKLMADIDLGGYTGTSYNIIGRLIYRGPGMFTGTFDGNRHTIYNFSYKTTGEYYIGLFGAVGGPDAEAEIKNLRVVDPNVDVGTGGDAGALVGLWFRPGTLSGCQVIGGHIRGSGGIGAIIGTNMFGNVSRCYSSTDVTAITVENGPAGGLVGINNYGSISECGTGGSVSSSGNIAGGLVGWGGGSGITNCYSTAVVTAQEFVGGLVGNNGSAITNSYAVGSVSGTGTYVGGLVGGTSGPITASFWDVNTSGQPGPWAGEGKTTAEMQMESTFTSAGWDFVGESSNGTDDIWDICEGTNYPKFVWQIPVGDFVCPDGVDWFDVGVLCEEWLLEELSCDVWPEGGDGFVDFRDWALIADGWVDAYDIFDLAEFAGQWLQSGSNYLVTDIAPGSDGDGITNGVDFAAVAENWLEGAI